MAQYIIEIPITEEEIEKEMQEQTEEFKRAGLLPIESEDKLND